MDTPDTIIDDATSFLETAVKIEEFNNVNIKEPKSNLLQVLLLKYKCILIFSISGIALFQFCLQIVRDIYADYEIKTLLHVLMNQTNTNKIE